jgi:hypothetical protein
MTFRIGLRYRITRFGAGVVGGVGKVIIDV